MEGWIVSEIRRDFLWLPFFSEEELVVNVGPATSSGRVGKVDGRMPAQGINTWQIGCWRSDEDRRRYFTWEEKLDLGIAISWELRWRSPCWQVLPTTVVKQRKWKILYVLTLWWSWAGVSQRRSRPPDASEERLVSLNMGQTCVLLFKPTVSRKKTFPIIQQHVHLCFASNLIEFLSKNFLAWSSAL